ncbi:MAG: C25 family cysteine peptidase, partial [Bacteroidota bacterium]
MRAEKAVERRVQEGALIVNYVGHGGERGWAHERVLDLPAIKSWTNLNRLPLFVTATCELARYDDPEVNSAGEEILLNESGGAIAMLTTTRIVTSGDNQDLNSAFFDVALEDQTIQNLTLGRISQETKNNVPPSANNRCFSLLGDVALILSYPEYEVQTTSINGVPLDGVNQETVNSLQEVTVAGKVTDQNGILLTDFNGFVYPTVFDKRSVVTALNNDGANTEFDFDVFKNLIYRGAATVTDGEFEFSFVVPRDINFELGTGRISYYCVDGNRDGHGHTEDFIIGGLLDGAELNDQGPDINLFMNDSTFVFGGTTDQSPFIFAKVFDENGVNTVGNGIGHDLKAVLDGNTNDPIIL